MSILAQAAVPETGPQIITICGDAGVGKSTLAATFPKPIFIQAEQGVSRIPADMRPPALPQVQDQPQLHEQLKALIHEDHGFQTVVIDTISALDRIFVAEILKQDGKAQSLNQALGGYGAGYNALASKHQQVRNAAELMRRKRGMNVVFLAHIEVDTVRPPDQDDFSRYSVRITHHKSLPTYIDDVDAVGLLRQRIVIKGDDGERKKAISDGGRELVMHLNAASVAKNPYGIKEPMDVNLGENPLAEFIKGTTK